MKPAVGLTPIRVLVAEDSAVARDLLVHLLNSDPQIKVVGVAGDGQQAVAQALHLRPDVITMDIHMPRMDGFTATRKIMETCPTRILMVTSSSLPYEVAATFKALEAGALTVLGKPTGPGHSDHRALADELIQTVKVMAEVAVVKRWPTAKAPATSTAPPAPPVAQGMAGIRAVAVGASTGGPLVLQTILSRLSAEFSAPILIVQHISTGFLEGLAQWLARSSGYQIRIALDGEMMRGGIAYFAPDGAHMTAQADGRIALTRELPEHGMRPSVSRLFRSVATSFGSRAIGVLLTGMGVDGAKELKQMREAGAITIAQDKESAVVNGMPGEAVKLNAANYVLAPTEIAALLQELVVRKSPL